MKTKFYNMRYLFIILGLVFVLHPYQARANGVVVTLDMDFATENNASAVFYDHFDSIAIGQSLFFRFKVTNVSSVPVYYFHISTDAELGHSLGISINDGLQPGAAWFAPWYWMNQPYFQGPPYGYGPTTTVDTSGSRHYNYGYVDWLENNYGTFATDSTYYITGQAPPTPAPEPMSLILLVMGLIGLAGTRRFIN